MGHGLDLVSGAQLGEGRVQERGDGLQVRDAGGGADEGGAHPLVQVHQGQQRLSGGDHANILQDAETILEEEGEELLVIVKVKLTVTTSGMIITLRVTNLDNLLEDNLNPLGLVGDKCLVSRYIRVTEKLPPQVIGEKINGLRRMSCEREQSIEIRFYVGWIARRVFRPEIAELLAKHGQNLNHFLQKVVVITVQFVLLSILGRCKQLTHHVGLEQAEELGPLPHLARPPAHYAQHALCGCHLQLGVREEVSQTPEQVLLIGHHVLDVDPLD